ncbi:MAG: nucleoside-diphosphate kinase [Candidatus Peribacteria bacterium]|nr:MAG: nucleoside-diphosphate kinase [Candidatus Peribacteria bacterium]
MSTLQKTLVVLKPDAVKRGIVGDIISRFEKVGLHLVALKMVQMDEALAHDHYEGIGKLKTRRGEAIFQVNAEFMRSGPVVAMVWEGVEAVELVRKMIGSTEPKSAAPGTIRGDYSHVSFGYTDQTKGWLPNLVHASAELDEAGPEIALWFSNDELFDHEVESHLYKRGHKK